MKDLNRIIPFRVPVSLRLGTNKKSEGLAFIIKTSSMSLLKRPRSPSFKSVGRILSAEYDDFNHHNVTNPLWELIFALCSTQTNERNYLAAYRALRQRFRSLKQLASARQDQLEITLRPGGLGPRKAKEICGILKKIILDFGKPTLALLKRMPDEECEAYLTELPGVGPKIARCVMMYSLGRKVFPVDVHCWRVSKRLGWVRRYKPTRNGEIEAMKRLESKIPPKLRHSLHVNLISLGREYCQLRPHCGGCPLVKICPKSGVPYG